VTVTLWTSPWPLALFILNPHARGPGPMLQASGAGTVDVEVLKLLRWLARCEVRSHGYPQLHMHSGRYRLKSWYEAGRSPLFSPPHLH